MFSSKDKADKALAWALVKRHVLQHSIYKGRLECIEHRRGIDLLSTYGPEDLSTAIEQFRKGDELYIKLEYQNQSTQDLWRAILEKRDRFIEQSKEMSLERFDNLMSRLAADAAWSSASIEGNTLSIKEAYDVVFNHEIERHGSDGREILAMYNIMMNLHDDVRRGVQHLTEEKTLYHWHKHAAAEDLEESKLGVYRKKPVHIVGSSAKLANPEDVPHLMELFLTELRRNWSSITDMDTLSLAAKSHYKFEKIHPFSDGNGRTGRILLNALLQSKGLLPISILPGARHLYFGALRQGDIQRRVDILERIIAESCLRSLDIGLSHKGISRKGKD